MLGLRCGEDPEEGAQGVGRDSQSCLHLRTRLNTGASDSPGLLEDVHIPTELLTLLSV